ncbi:MAG TPA: hypothetical protein VK576_07175 [Thermoleophilia bacterium]|nr:hypothetical protein [Thermoleophilia bacterium]
MADDLHAGSNLFSSPGDDTMAAAIERHLRDLMQSPPPTDDTPEARDRRVLFAGIARGVIEHLKHHPEALEVVFTAVPSNHNVSQFAAHVQVKASDVP